MKICNPFATFFFVFWRKCVHFWGDINLVKIEFNNKKGEIKNRE